MLLVGLRVHVINGTYWF